VPIIDRRLNGKNKSAPNRRKFIRRYKEQLKEQVDKIADGKNLKDMKDGTKIKVKKKDISEPTFRNDPKSGERDIVLPGNDQYNRGDSIDKPPQGEDGRGTQGGLGEDGEDEFSFTLSKKEFLELYFSDLELPNFIKESIAKTKKYKIKRAGFQREGLPASLDLKKTMTQAFARRIVQKERIFKLQDKINEAEERGEDVTALMEELERIKVPYIDDTDIRYRRFEKQPLPIMKAAMICIMDVSASMGEYEKVLAKKFYLLLYLFLEQNYENIELVFIRHTTTADEVDERTFFEGRRTGGTLVSSGLALAYKIIKERFPINDWNVYVAQASDGDNWTNDNNDIINILEEKLLPLVQYFVYIQIQHPWMDPSDYLVSRYENEYPDLYSLYSPLTNKHEKFNAQVIYDPKDVYPIFRNLFEKR